MKSDSDLIQALSRDVRWLEGELKRIRDAKALNADKLRAIASESLERAKLRGKRTRSVQARGSSIGSR